MYCVWLRWRRQFIVSNRSLIIGRIGCLLYLRCAQQSVGVVAVAIRIAAGNISQFAGCNRIREYGMAIGNLVVLNKSLVIVPVNDGI